VADYQAVARGVRARVAAGAEAAPDDELADLAAAYAALCREANLRLRRCAEYARLGGHAEAAHLAGCEPPLERLAPALALPELRAWNELCARHGLPRAPAVLAEALGDVRAAVAAERRLGPLLARHRALAVARAPVRERLRVARLLLAHDPGSPAWPDEVRRLEAARLAELLAAVTRPVPGGGGTAQADASRELDETAWTADVPPELAEAVRPARERREAAAARAAVAGLVELLLRADLADLPAERVAAAADAWESLAAGHGFAESATKERVDAAVARFRAAERSRRAAEDAKVLGDMFRATPGEEPAPPRRRVAKTLVLTALLVAAACLIYVTLQQYPQAYAKIRSFIVGP
jgi:hypothetical protein